MSLHATLSPEAQQRLHAQRRNSTISSVVIAVLVVVLIAIVLGVFLLPKLEITSATVVIYENNVTVDPEPELKKLSTHMERKPSSPSSSIARVITARMDSPTAVPVPEVDVTSPSVDFGSGDDFGEGWQGAGNGAGAGGGGGGFGSSNRSSGGLEGRMYDFKQKPDGKEISYDLANPAEFVDRVLRLQRADFSEASLSRHFQAPNSLFLTHLAIPYSAAAGGPQFFGAQDAIKPSGWVVHYRGKITVPKSGTYRFSGLGDDYLVVMLNRRMRLAASWGSIQKDVAGRWDASEPTGSHKGPFRDMPLIYGDWMNLKTGDSLDLDLAIGERPGGMVGFVLQIEEKGVDYRKTPDGRPILPLFTTTPFSDEEKSRVTREFGSYEFEWDKVPVFRAQ